MKLETIWTKVVLLLCSASESHSIHEVGFLTWMFLSFFLATMYDGAPELFMQLLHSCIKHLVHCMRISSHPACLNSVHLASS